MVNNNLEGSYSKWLEEKHNESCTIVNFKNKMEELTSKYDFDSETLECIAKYSANAIAKISVEPKEVQEHSMLVNVLDKETDNLVEELKKQRVYGWTKVNLAIHNAENAANDDNFSAAA